MQWARVVATAMAVLSVATAAMTISCSKQPGTEGAPLIGGRAAEGRVPLGKRLAWAGGCVDCHTPGAMYGAPDTTRMLSGSELGWVGPWGVSYPRNLTPDSTFGIGAWTEAQIATAIRAGQRPDGSPILPPMPWPSFGIGLTDDEALAIAAYLKTLPAIAHRVPAVIPPGQPVTGGALAFPPPPAWDAQNLPPPPAGGMPAGSTH